jgi:drug/metabolite transporter (DMT)-like permease
MVVGQLLLKKGLIGVGQFPADWSGITNYLAKVFVNPFVLFSVFLIILASVAWILTVSRAGLSRVYPFMGLAYVLVAISSVALFKENVTYWGWIGIALVSVGVCLVLKG